MRNYRRLAGWSLLLTTLGLCHCAAPVGKKDHPKVTHVSKLHAAAEESVLAKDNHADPQGPVSRMRVNNETVDATELWVDAADDIKARGANLPADEYQRFVEREAAQLITDKIAEMLLYQTSSLRLEEGERKQLDTIADQELRRIVSERHAGVQGEFERHLAARGQTLDEVRDHLRRRLTIAAHLERELRPRVSEPTRSELLELYENVRQSMGQEPRRSMSLIEVRVGDRLPRDVDDPTPAQLGEAKSAARARADAAMLELRAGKPFADVARNYSDSGRAIEGGAWGWVTREGVRERYTPALDRLFAMSKGDVSEIIEVPDGFFIVRCDDAVDGVTPTFESAQPELIRRHGDLAFSRLVGELVQDLRKRARIEPADMDRFFAAVVAAAPQQPHISQ